MPENLIRSVDQKLARAKAQVQMLADAIDAWAPANAKVTASVALREERLGFRLTVTDFVEPPAGEWGLLVGECIHNLRSALDNLAFALARLHSDPPQKPARISFPIYLDKSEFAKKASAALDQMPTRAAHLIESLQPFNRDGSPSKGTPESDGLLVLQSLNNVDKHRVPSVVLVGQVDAEHEAFIEYPTEEDAAKNLPPDTTVWNGPIGLGVVLLEWRTITPVVRVSGTYKVRAVLALETDSGVPQLIPLLQSLSTYTEIVVDQFRGFFA
jgi:hypothetical protein